MKIRSVGTIVICILLGIGGIFVYFRKDLEGLRPVVETPSTTIEQAFEQQTGADSDTKPVTVDFPLHLADGFEISLFAKNVNNARVMAMDSRGNLWVSRTKDGVISMLDIENGVVVAQADIFKNMKNPHGIAFDPEYPNVLFIAEEDKLDRVEIYRDAPAFEKEKGSDIDAVKGTLTTAQVAPYGVEGIVDLPGAGRHFTRTLLFDKDGNLFVSIGSTCDVCHEKDDRISTVMRVVFDDEFHTKAHLEPFASGLRNSVFMAVQPQTKKIWATDMGRDNLGNNIPPDEINIIENGKNYGWPNCYGKNIHDDVFDKNTYIRNPCMSPFETPSYIDLPAHSAALGLAFVPADSAWPKEYWNNLLIAYHGSWNRTVPTGYKIVRYALDESGKWTGEKPEEQDFITGWLKGGKESYGRPVDILMQNDAMFVSDDKAGVIYKVYYLKK